MDNRFEIKPIVEQKPFEIPSIQSFFAKWFEINDSIIPQVISRVDWEKRDVKEILEKTPDGKQILYLPADLQLWEMVGVMEVVDYDTFAEKPQRRDEAKKKIAELGNTFKNTGTYIAQRLDSIAEGREIARAMAEEFYDYGESLASGKKSEEPENIENISSHKLSASELEAVDRFLAGDNLYKSRKTSAEKAAAGNPLEKDIFVELERQKTLAQFFRVSKKAFELQKRNEEGELKKNTSHLKSWQSKAPFESAFIAKVERAMQQKIETPERGLAAAVFRRGLEKLLSEMRERGWKKSVNDFLKKNGIDLRIEQKKLMDALNIKGLRTELQNIRKSGNADKISKKEEEITNKIQRAISSLQYDESANNPSDIVANQYINCIGASSLGGALMHEAGVNYLVGSMPGHSILFLITENGRVKFRDMRESSFNENLTDDMIQGYKKDGSSLSVADIAAFSREQTGERLNLVIQSKNFRETLQSVRDGQRLFVTMYGPESGQQIQLLHNTGIALSELGRNEEAIEAYRQIIALDPKNPDSYKGLGRAYYNLHAYTQAIEIYRQSIALDDKDAGTFFYLGNSFFNLERYDEAIEAYRKVIALKPKNPYNYQVLGKAFMASKRNEEALDVYQKAVAIDPKFAYPYYGLGNAFVSLGMKEYGANAYQKFIDLADKEKDKDWIDKAEKIIAELKNK